MYQLFIANKNYSSWSLRPWLVLTELQIPFVERQFLFAGADNAVAFRAFAPNGKVPCLHDAQTVVWDSLAIIEYLAERHAGVWPEDASARAFARCAAAEMHSGFTSLRSYCPMNVGIRVHIDEIPAALQRDLTRLSELWQQGLTQFGGPFLAGATFSAVDAFFASVAFRVQTCQLPLPEAARAYVDRLLALPGMQAWQQAALQETSRDPSHEVESAAVGRVIADHRTA